VHEQNQRWAAQPTGAQRCRSRAGPRRRRELAFGNGFTVSGRAGLGRLPAPTLQLVAQMDQRSRWLLGRQPQIVDDAAKQAIVVVDRLQGTAYLFKG
jgi:hypothetical protein